MPYGKGTYGSKVGRPPKKKSKKSKQLLRLKLRQEGQIADTKAKAKARR